MNDIHTHILPAVDDGSKNGEMSIEMIKRLSAEGVRRIVLTPHFYASRNSVDSFLRKRECSLNELKEAIGEEKLDVELYVGAEVLFMDSLDRVEGFERMAIDGTKYMLLEMPFETWGGRTVDTVYRIISNGITPIIAHFERYIPMKNMDKIYELKRLGCILQMNAENFNSFFSRRKALKFFEEGTARLLGSDCHNLESRPPEIRFAYDAIAKKLGDDSVNEIISLGDKILENANRII
ncbi:MAG: hypothetical protein J1F63_01975 [Oscillospiraceae bacterium]|nr:hypothetical protein [Oscillospiraceae bacterium]